jgi:DNA-binding IclR family transcriptional regulator
LIARNVEIKCHDFHIMKWHASSMANPGGTIQVIDRAAELLRLLSESGGDGVGLSFLAQGAGLTVPTAHRILAALAKHGLVAKDTGGRRYRLGMSLFVLGSRAADTVGVRARCRATLAQLCAETGDTVFLMVRQGFRSICVDRCDGNHVIQTISGGIGGGAPLGVGPGSQAILAFLEDEEARAILDRNGSLYDGYQGHSLEIVRRALADTRRLGYALDVNGIIPGVSGIAVPIRPADGSTPSASLGIGLLSSKLTNERLIHLAHRLQDEAAALGGAVSPLASFIPREQGAGLRPSGETA